MQQNLQKQVEVSTRLPGAMHTQGALHLRPTAYLGTRTLRVQRTAATIVDIAAISCNMK